MFDINNIVKKLQQNNQKIKMNDIYELQLNEADFDLLLQTLEKLNIDIESLNEEKVEESDNSYNEVYFSEDSIKMYLREIGRYKILTPEQEKELFLKLEAGDQKARKTIIESNLKLVVSIAKKYIGNNIPLLDLIQEGNKGLLKAVDKFDVSKGYKFSTYSSWWIRQCVVRAIYDHSRTIRLPVHMSELTKKVKKYEELFLSKEKRMPTNQEIADEFNTSLKNVELIKRFGDNIVSLDVEIKEGEGDGLIEFVADETNIEKEFIEKEESKNILEIMKRTLSDREYRILCLRNGLSEYGRELSLEEIATIYDLTRERIRQIETKALRRMRCVLKRNYAEEFNLPETSKYFKYHR